MRPDWMNRLPPETATMTRRRFGELMAASMALATGGCNAGPAEQVVALPEAHLDENLGPVLHYATQWEADGWAVGVRARCRDGRPLLVTGDPVHPASRGGIGIHAQADLLRLYDPQRPRTCRSGAEPTAWRRVRQQLSAIEPGGEGLHIAMPPTSSSTIRRLVEAVRQRHPAVQVHALGAADPRSQASLQLTGQALIPIPDCARAQVVACFDDDLLSEGAWAARQAHDLGTRRGTSEDRPEVFVAEPMPTPTGIFADHRLALAAHHVPAALVAVVRRLADRLQFDLPAALPADEQQPAHVQSWLDRLTARLLAQREQAMITVGIHQPVLAHILAAWANQMLGTGVLQQAPDPRHPRADGSDEVRLAAALDAGEVRNLVVLGGNPAYTAAGELEMPFALQQAGRCWYLGDEDDETAQVSTTFIPRRHWLERWRELRAMDGTWCIGQPALRPLGDGSDEIGVLAALAGERQDDALTLIRETFQQRSGDDGNASLPDWQQLVQRGHMPDSADLRSREDVAVNQVSAAIGNASLPTSAGQPQLLVRPDHKLGDGRFASNGWLQELPAPVTTLTWENAVHLSASMAAMHGLENGDLVHLGVGERAVVAPALVVPGMAADTALLPRGYGRRHGIGGAYQDGVSAQPLQPTADVPWQDVALRKRGGAVELALIQDHWQGAVERDLVQTTSGAHGDEVAAAHGGSHHTPPSLRSAVVDEGLQWGMAIDLDQCSGCGACMVACQAENNVPIVGKDLVKRSLEMHWLRIDHYYTDQGDSDQLGDPRFLPQPMACQHCEKAPCEYVCPVGATSHSDDGLNEMTYNRCVGTRFCANNCPYKVRRFNFYEYNGDTDPIADLQHNPTVSVRARGVMEKCTYCVQRIREQQQTAAAAGQAFDHHNVVTACESACPTRAIVFGDINDAESDVAQARASQRSYYALEDTGAAPRTTYLKRIVPAADDEAES